VPFLVSAGGLHRVFLAKDKERNTSRGFAFVSFYNKADAQRAMDELQVTRRPSDYTTLSRG
jgi:RNA recognition motif-containing protein